MKSKSRIIIGIIAILVYILPAYPAWAADEDMISQVYLEFDPETGEFKTALDPTAQAKNKHMQAQQLEQIQQNQDNLVNQQKPANAQTPAAAPAKPQSMPVDETARGSNTTILIAGAVGLILLIGIVALVRKNQQTA
jgi:hypothetical protein